MVRGLQGSTLLTLVETDIRIRLSRSHFGPSRSAVFPEQSQLVSSVSSVVSLTSCRETEKRHVVCGRSEKLFGYLGGRLTG